MIRYDLRCEQGHGFESWFQSSSAYDSQRKRKLGPRFDPLRLEAGKRRAGSLRAHQSPSVRGRSDGAATT